MRKRNTKNEIQIRFSKWWENEKQKPKFKSPFQSAAKKENEIQIRLSMSQVDKKRKIEMEMIFNLQGRRKTKNKNEIWIPVFYAIEKRLALRYTNWFSIFAYELKIKWTNNPRTNFAENNSITA